MNRDRDVIATIRPSLLDLTGSAGDYDALLDLIGPAHFVLLCEVGRDQRPSYRVGRDDACS